MFQRLQTYIVMAMMLSLVPGRVLAFAEEVSWPDGSIIATIQVKIEEEHPNGFDWQRLARALIRLDQGDLLTRERLDAIEKNLAFFFETTFKVTPQPQGVGLEFYLRPLKRIKSIDVDGAYPLFEKDVLNVMTLAAGDIFRPDQMPDQEALVADRYRTEGYIDPQVKIHWRQDADDGHYHLEVDIQKGPYYVLEKIELNGNHAFRDDDLLSRMSTWRKATFMLGAGRFEPQDLKADIRNLLEFYRGLGFVEATIEPTESYDAQRGTVRCKLTIQEGQRHVLRIKGNRYYSEFTLRRDLVVFKSGNIGNIGVRRSVQNIRRRYLNKGFADVKVRWESNAGNVNGESVVLVSILIEEGARHIVEAVQLMGNAHMDSATILGQMLTRPPKGLVSGAFVVNTLQEDLAAVNALYYNEGFLSVQIKPIVEIEPDTAKVKVMLQIDEGVQTRVGNVAIQGQTPIPAETLAAGLGLQPDDPFVPSRLQAGENQLSARISMLGYPHVRVQSTSAMSDDQARADIIFTVDSGPPVKVGEIFFLGNFRTRDRLMMRELGFDTGDPFILQKTLEAQRNLRNLNIFDSVQVRTVGLKEVADEVHLLVVAMEKKPYYLETAGGYRTDKGFYGRAKIGDHNFLGLAKDVSLSVEGSQVGNRWEGSIADPRFLGTSVKAKAGVYSERSEPFNQNIGTTTAGANAHFSYDWGHYYTNALAVKYERRQQYQRTPVNIDKSLDPETFEPRTVTVTTPSIEYDSRDYFIQPHQGALAALAVDISKGLESSVDDFLKYRLDLRLYHPLHPRVTLAGRVWTGYIVSYGDPPALDQLLYLGGASTVRGFEENLLRYDENGKAVGGLLTLAASLETRIDIGRNFELIPFVDTGSVRDAQVDDAGDDSFRWAAGLGLEYVTPIGPIGLFYGLKLDRRPGESSGQVHVSIGYTF